jgi:hypothetical protein
VRRELLPQHSETIHGVGLLEIKIGATATISLDFRNPAKWTPMGERVPIIPGNFNF